jgi:hypothetical protein
MRKIPQIVRAQPASFILPVYSSVVSQSPYEIHLPTALMLFLGLLQIQQSTAVGYQRLARKKITCSDGFQVVYRGAPCPLPTSLGTGDLQVVPPMMSYDHM